MKKINTLTSIAFVIAILLTGFAEVLAQNFTNNVNGTYIAAPEAVIKMKSATGVFNGGATALGSAAGLRIQGIVDWADDTDGQPIQPLFYTNLTATGGTKTIAGGVHVGGVGSANPLPGKPEYVNITGGMGYYPTNGTRTYTAAGIFFYDGTEDQKIFAEAGTSGQTNRYQTLDLSASDKTTAGDITMDGNLLVHTDATMSNAFNFTLGDGASLIEGNVTNTGLAATSSFKTVGLATATLTVDGATFLVDGGTLALQSLGHFIITNDGNLTLASGTEDGLLAMATGSYLENAGNFTNTALNHANMTFADGSTVEYSGVGATQNVVATVATASTNEYAALIFSGAANKVLEATADADIYTRSTVNISGGNVVLSVGNTNDETRSLFTDATGGSKITFPVADMPYIQGNVVLDGTIAGDVAYTLNNYETQITFVAGKTPTTFGFNVQAATEPLKGNDFDPTHDVSRSINANFDLTAQTIIKNLRVGYATTDLISGFTADERLMRYLEGYDLNQPTQKITGGAGIATNSATVAPGGTHWVNLITNATDAVELVATAGGGTIRQVSDQSNIILSATPMLFIAVNNGRWTNPNTWDEGIYPSSTDNALIRALVYTGINGPAYGTAAANNLTAEYDVYGDGTPPDSRTYNGALSHSITIDTDPTPGDNLPYALIIGNSDIGTLDGSENPSNYIAHPGIDATVDIGGFLAGFYNNNPGVNTGDWNIPTLAPDGTNTVNGLWVSKVGNSASNTVTFASPKIENAGTITNHSVIEIGN